MSDAAMVEFNGSVEVTYSEFGALGGQIARVTFGCGASNSLPRALLTKLSSTINEVSASKTVRVIVLQSAAPLAKNGRGPFCAGAAFEELLQIKTVAQGELFFSGFAEVILSLNRAPQVTIAKVHGKAAGGGVGLACATDYTVATSDAAIRLSELALGIGPFTIGPVVQRRTGPAAFTELALSAEWRDSQWAKAARIFTEVLPDAQTLELRLEELCARFAGYPRTATEQVKKMSGAGFNESLESILTARVRAVSELVITPEAQALIQAAATQKS